jgi:hypothetical protein
MFGRDVHTELWLEILEERQCMENLTAYDRIILKYILEKQNVRMQNGCIWMRRLRIGANGIILYHDKLSDFT